MRRKKKKEKKLVRVYRYILHYDFMIEKKRYYYLGELPHEKAIKEKNSLLNKYQKAIESGKTCKMERCAVIAEWTGQFIETD